MATTQTVEPRINVVSKSPEVPVAEVVTKAAPVYEPVTKEIPEENPKILKEPTVIKESEGVVMKEPENIKSTDVAIQSMLKDKDRMRREIEVN